MFLGEFKDWIEKRTWQFVRKVASTNRDFPYHDFLAVTNESETDELAGHYVVGQNNINAQGDQHKRFVAKRTIIWNKYYDVTFRLNHANNVEIHLIPRYFDPHSTNEVHMIELHCDVSEIFYAAAVESTTYFYFEGVLPEEARDAE